MKQFKSFKLITYYLQTYNAGSIPACNAFFLILLAFPHSQNFMFACCVNLRIT